MSPMTRACQNKPNSITCFPYGMWTYIFAGSPWFLWSGCLFFFYQENKKRPLTSEIFESRAVINFFMIKSVLGQLCCILITILIRLLAGNGRWIFFFSLFGPLSKLPGKVSCLHGAQRRATSLPFAVPTSVALPVSTAAIAVIFICW